MSSIAIVLAVAADHLGALLVAGLTWSLIGLVLGLVAVVGYYVAMRKLSPLPASPRWPLVVFLCSLLFVALPAVTLASCSTGVRDRTTSLLLDDLDESGAHTAIGSLIALPLRAAMAQQEAADARYLLDAKQVGESVGKMAADLVDRAVDETKKDIDQDNRVIAWLTELAVDRAAKKLKDKSRDITELLATVKADESGKLSHESAHRQLGRAVTQRYVMVEVEAAFDSVRLQLLVIGLLLPVIVLLLLRWRLKRGSSAPGS